MYSLRGSLYRCFVSPVQAARKQSLNPISASLKHLTSSCVNHPFPFHLVCSVWLMDPKACSWRSIMPVRELKSYAIMHLYLKATWIDHKLDSTKPSHSAEIALLADIWLVCSVWEQQSARASSCVLAGAFAWRAISCTDLERICSR